jgi:hypothetical protein
VIPNLRSLSIEELYNLLRWDNRLFRKKLDMWKEKIQSISYFTLCHFQVGWFAVAVHRPTSVRDLSSLFLL